MIKKYYKFQGIYIQYYVITYTWINVRNDVTYLYMNKKESKKI